MNELKPGEIGWCDLTVNAAEEVKSFYTSVIGWRESPVNMGDYNDYSMQLSDGEKDITGICHAKGENADMPAQWLLYFIVDDLQRAMAEVDRNGGKILSKIKHFGDSSFVVIEDPAGAVCAIYQQ